MGTIIDLPQPSGTLLSTQHLFRNLSIKAFSSSPPSFSNSICIPSSPGVFPLFIFLTASSNSSSVIPSSSTPSSFLSSSSLSPSSSGCTSTFSNSSKYSIHLLFFFLQAYQCFTISIFDITYSPLRSSIRSCQSKNLLLAFLPIIHQFLC